MRSKDTVDDDSQAQENDYFLGYMSKKTSTYFDDSMLPGLQLDDLYNHFEVSLTGFEVRPCVHAVSVNLYSTSTRTSEKYMSVCR